MDAVTLRELGADLTIGLAEHRGDALGRPDDARAALERFAELNPEAYADPAAEYRMHGGTEATVNALVAGLRKAGWTRPRAGPTN